MDCCRFRRCSARGNAPPFEPGETALHGAPTDGKAVAVIRVDQNWSFAPHGGCEGLEVSIHRGGQHEELPTLEYDYEMPGAIVLEQRDGWLKVRLLNGSAWVKPSAVDQFMPLRDLFEEFVGVTAINNRSAAASPARPPC